MHPSMPLTHIPSHVMYCTFQNRIIVLSGEKLENDIVQLLQNKEHNKEVLLGQASKIQK